jgi:FkbM family methyltransferase
MLQKMIPRLLGQVPIAWRRTIIGGSDNPSRISTLLHNILNRVAVSDTQIYPCQGPLQGYRMCIDWKRFRSFVYGTWEPEVIDAVVSTIKPGMTVIDIGAHIGYYSLLFAKFAGPSGRIFSFEPLPGNFALLQKNVQLNNLQYVTPLNLALFSHSGEITITVPDGQHNPGNGSVYIDHGAQQFRVQSVTLDHFCATSAIQPDFLKIDVEGAELAVLLGGRTTIERFRPNMLIELHHFDGNLAAHPVPDLLTNWGYQLQWIERWQLTSHILAVPGAAARMETPGTSSS